MIVLHIESENYDTNEIKKECVVVDKVTKKFIDDYIYNNYFQYTYADVKGSAVTYRTLSKCAIVTAFKPTYIKGEIMS